MIKKEDFKQVNDNVLDARQDESQYDYLYVYSFNGEKSIRKEEDNLYLQGYVAISGEFVPNDEFKEFGEANWNNLVKERITGCENGDCFFDGKIAEKIFNNIASSKIAESIDNYEINYSEESKLNWLYKPDNINDLACQDYRWISVFSSDSFAEHAPNRDKRTEASNTYKVNNKITNHEDEVYYMGFLFVSGDVQNGIFIPDEKLKNVDFDDLFSKYCSCDEEATFTYDSEIHKTYDCRNFNVDCWGNGDVYCSLFPDNEYCKKYDQIIPDIMCE